MIGLSWSVGDKSRLHVLTSRKANTWRKLTRTPDCDSYRLQQAAVQRIPIGIDNIIEPTTKPPMAVANRIRGGATTPQIKPQSEKAKHVGNTTSQSFLGCLWPKEATA